jgi:hypothetical protein
MTDERVNRAFRISAAALAASALAALTGIAQAQQLSAVDAFNLRGECHQLGQKLIADEDNLWSMAYMVTPSAWDRYTDTNYNASDNRCYVLIQQSPSAHGEKLGLNCRRTYLRDGQTKESVAWTEDGPACKRNQNGALEASHYGVVMEKIGADFDVAHDFITEKMRR